MEAIAGNILIVDDEELILWSLEKALSKEGYQVVGVTTGREAQQIIEDDPPEIVLLDLVLPDIHGMELFQRMREAMQDTAVIVITAHGDVDMAVRAMKMGAYDFISKPFDLERVRIVIRRALSAVKLKKEARRVRNLRGRKNSFGEIIGQSLAMRKVFEVVEKVAGCGATTVLLEGESGTGKELIARAVHFQSDRHDQPFVEVNCTTLPETLMESELLGHEKGAFTDAKTSRAGLFEQAHGGTLFLDEIGDMKLDMQVKLLKLIEEKRIRRVGGNRDIPVDLRIVAASNRRLEELIKEGRFREDLYYRLKVFPIYLPPLRERREDIPLLAHFFTDEFNHALRKSIKGITPEALEALEEYPWPGNVRELKNVIERAMILAQGENLDMEDLPSGVVEHFRLISEEGSTIKLPPQGISLETVERELLRQALERTQGNQTYAARLLQISRPTLRYRMEKHGYLDSSPSP